RALHMSDRPVKIVQAHVLKRFMEDLPAERKEVNPERPAAADGVLPQAGLRLMQAQGSPLPQRRALMVWIESPRLEALADLVQDSEEGITEVVRSVAGRDPDIARADRAEERMHGAIEPATLEVEADDRRHLLPEDPLPIGRKVAMQHCNLGSRSMIGNRG